MSVLWMIGNEKELEEGFGTCQAVLGAGTQLWVALARSRGARSPRIAQMSRTGVEFPGGVHAHLTLTLDADAVYSDLGAFPNAAALRHAGLLRPNVANRHLIIALSAGPSHYIPVIASVALEGTLVDCWSSISHRPELSAARDALIARLYGDAAAMDVAVFVPIAPEFIGTGFALTASTALSDRVRDRLSAQEADRQKAKRAMDAGGLWPR